MALLFMDGFDHSGTAIDSHKTKYNFADTIGAVLTASTIRTGTGALRSISGIELNKVIPSIAMGTAFIVGYAFQKPANPASNTSLWLSSQFGVVSHIGFGINTSGQLIVIRDTVATVLATGATILANNSWYYIEFKGIIHDTTGSYELRIDGITELTATNVDTRNGGTGVVDSVIIKAASATNLYFDDYYVCDGTGSAPTNTFLGSVKVETLLPQTDAVAVGSNTGLTPSTGTDHGALVDENPPNTTDYNGSATVGLKDTYNYPAMTLAGTIMGVQSNLYVVKSDAGAKSVCSVVRSGGADTDGANVNPLTTFSYLPTVHPVNPNGSVAWTPTTVNAAEFGMKVTV